MMLSPAMVLLITFTHYPAVQTIINSFLLDRRGAAANPCGLAWTTIRR